MQRPCLLAATRRVEFVDRRKIMAAALGGNKETFVLPEHIGIYDPCPQLGLHSNQGSVAFDRRVAQLLWLWQSI